MSRYIGCGWLLLALAGAWVAFSCYVTRAHYTEGLGGNIRAMIEEKVEAGVPLDRFVGRWDHESFQTWGTEYTRGWDLGEFELWVAPNGVGNGFSLMVRGKDGVWFVDGDPAADTQTGRWSPAVWYLSGTGLPMLLMLALWTLLRPARGNIEAPRSA